MALAVPIKRTANLPTVFELDSKHAVCCKPNWMHCCTEWATFEYSYSMASSSKCVEMNSAFEL